MSTLYAASWQLIVDRSPGGGGVLDSFVVWCGVARRL